MQARHAPWIAFLFLCLVLLGGAVYYLPMLPDRMAVHFGISGHADGWSNKATFIRSIAGGPITIAIIFCLAGWLNRIPEGLINLPNKRYWLGPERREATFAYIRDWLRWFLVLVLALLTLVQGMTVRANLVASQGFPENFIWLMIAFGVVGLGMIIVLVRRFRAPPHVSAHSS